MKRTAQILLIAAVMSGVVVGVERKGSFDLTVQKVVVTEKRGSFDITDLEKKGSFDITEKREPVVTELSKKGSFDLDGKDPEVPVDPK